MFGHAHQGGLVVFTSHHPLSGHHDGLRTLELAT
jgi:ABC-type transport system involved in cytochrome c biogenesis ATPase subunit